MTFELKAYWKGRDVEYASELTDELRSNAQATCTQADAFVSLYEFATGKTHNRAIHSGWRPFAVNAATPGAAKKSKHTLCQAIDIDDEDGGLDEWAMTPEGQAALAKCGLWLEHPGSTKGWCHVQTVQYGSWNTLKPRWFYP